MLGLHGYTTTLGLDFYVCLLLFLYVIHPSISSEHSGGGRATGFRAPSPGLPLTQHVGIWKVMSLLPMASIPSSIRELSKAQMLSLMLKCAKSVLCPKGFKAGGGRHASHRTAWACRHCATAQKNLIPRAGRRAQRLG